MNETDALKIINDFLHKKEKDDVCVKDRLFSSGILSSIEMFELILEFERLGINISQGSGLMLSMLEVDSVQSIINQVCK